jgi:hypothetical protein
MEDHGSANNAEPTSNFLRMKALFLVGCRFGRSRGQAVWQKTVEGCGQCLGKALAVGFGVAQAWPRSLDLHAGYAVVGMAVAGHCVPAAEVGKGWDGQARAWGGGETLFLEPGAEAGWAAEEFTVGQGGATGQQFRATAGGEGRCVEDGLGLGEVGGLVQPAEFDLGDRMAVAVQIEEEGPAVAIDGRVAGLFDEGVVFLPGLAGGGVVLGGLAEFAVGVELGAVQVADHQVWAGTGVGGDGIGHCAGQFLGVGVHGQDPIAAVGQVSGFLATAMWGGEDQRQFPGLEFHEVARAEPGIGGQGRCGEQEEEESFHSVGLEASGGGAWLAELAGGPEDGARNEVFEAWGVFRVRAGDEDTTAAEGGGGEGG